MSEPPFEPIPVPLSTKALVATLKRRLIDAVDNGRAADAKIFLDVIERLARMDWLDELTPKERFERERAERAQILAELDKRLIALINDDTPAT